jgi:hypothetical protein
MLGPYSRDGAWAAYIGAVALPTSTKASQPGSVRGSGCDLCMAAPDDTLSAVTPTATPATAPSRRRWVGKLAIGLLLLFAIGDIWLHRANWGFEDVRAYCRAAAAPRPSIWWTPVEQLRLPLRAGFAWMWVPLTPVPRQVTGCWERAAGFSLAVLGALFACAAGGGPPSSSCRCSSRSSGRQRPARWWPRWPSASPVQRPAWIALAASIKTAPILLHARLRRSPPWMRVAVTLVVTAVLLAPLLFADVSAYQTNPGASFSVYYYVSPLAWAAAAAASIVVAAWLAWRRSDWVWVAASVAVGLCAPRAHATYATFLAVGLLDVARDRIERRTLGDLPRTTASRDSSVEE